MTDGSNWFDRKKSRWGDIFNICHSLLEFQPLSNQSLGDNMKKYMSLASIIIVNTEYTI